MTRIFAKLTTAVAASMLLAPVAFAGAAAAQAPPPNKDTAPDRQDRVIGTQGGNTLIIQHRSQATGDRTTIVAPAPSEAAEEGSYSGAPIVVYPEITVPVPPQRPKPPIIYRPGQ